ncbi:VPLPA-CTERM sorting domain-containing protein [Porticoccaceae bacterium]|nr:VPLPA-CTERM sorting domain-containing protein [Porticoccaceae bacterium]
MTISKMRTTFTFTCYVVLFYTYGISRVFAFALSLFLGDIKELDMNRNLSKLLQSLAGAVVLSMASLSMAATWDYDFDNGDQEYGGQPLTFGDLKVYGYKDGESANAYLDGGTLAGMGVCGTLLTTPTSGEPTDNWCDPASDDNLQANEVLKFVFEETKKVSVVGINGAHVSAEGEKVRIWTDTMGWDLIEVIAGNLSLGFDLETLKVFGTMTGSKALEWGAGTTADLYVAGINEVPIPAAVWLFGSALLGLTGLRRRKVAV